MYERILSMCVDNRVSLPGNFVFVSTVLLEKIMSELIWEWLNRTYATLFLMKKVLI